MSPAVCLFEYVHMTADAAEARIVSCSGIGITVLDWLGVCAGFSAKEVLTLKCRVSLHPFLKVAFLGN